MAEGGFRCPKELTVVRGRGRNPAPGGSQHGRECKVVQGERVVQRNVIFERVLDLPQKQGVQVEVENPDEPQFG